MDREKIKAVVIHYVKLIALFIVLMLILQVVKNF